jgi:hypothetical protein
MSLLLAALLVSAQPAADQSAPAPATAEAPKTVKPKKICKADDAASGSRMAKRLCLTEEEWAQRSKGMTESARSGFSGKAADPDH